MIEYNPLLCLDFYKTCHADQYNKNLTKMVSYYTPRMSRIEDLDKCVLFGLQGFIGEYLIKAFNDYFFSQPLRVIINQYERVMMYTSGTMGIGEERIEDLHRLGYLPLEIRAVPEGSRTNIKVPQIEISNTHHNFVWLVNSIETMLSTTLWHTQISTEVGYRYRQIVNKYVSEVCDDCVSPSALLGDFSMRGQESIESGTKSSAGFLMSFINTATVPSILWLENYYDTNIEEYLIGRGAVSTEHSVMCSNASIDGSEDYFPEKLLKVLYPCTSFSMVSDSYDYWNMVDNILPSLKEQILSHKGYIGIRGDSGNPVEIVTETVFRLWNTFGGTINSKGYQVLDSHIKVIYGDSITPQRCEAIYKILTEKGFCISNVVLGVGSFSMQCLENGDDENVSYAPYTRDTLGIAVKATYAEDYNEKPIMIFKNPKTDTGNFKQSQKGCCRVIEKDGEYSYIDGLTWKESQNNNVLQTVFKNGKLTKTYTVAEVRRNLHKGEF